MRIALASTVSAPVRQDSHGSVEAWIWLLARELLKLGHHVTIFGCAGAETEAEMVSTLPGPYGAQGSYDDWHVCEWVNLCRAVDESERFDVIHAQAYLWSIPLQNIARAPIVHTMHIVPDHDAARLWEKAPQACVTAISRHQWSGFTHLQPVAVIPHGVDLSQFAFCNAPDDYLLYLGRFTSGKGPIQAIQAARSLGMRLILAGPESPYFREKVRPLVDGKFIEYAGYVRPAERNRLLGGARALVYPIQYAEAFGLVLVEAMLCGTPIAATSFGAVPEIVEDGFSGFVASLPDQVPDAIRRCLSLDRHAIHRRARERFAPEKMAREYSAVYSKLAALA